MKPAFLLIFLIILIPSPALAIHYNVQSAYDDLPKTSSSSPDQVEIWALPVWLFLTELLLLNPFILFLIKGMVSLGYRRITPDTLLDSLCRRDIYSLIEEEPGIHLRGIAGRLSMELGTVRHHLDQLERYHLVSKIHSGGFSRYYPPGYTKEEKMFLGLTASTSRREIIRILMKTPGMNRQEIGKRLKITAQAAGWHLARLAEEGIVIPTRSGRSVNYSLSLRTEIRDR